MGKQLTTYIVTVKDDFFGRELSGDFAARDEQEARRDARRFYAHELDTTMNEVNIISCVKK